MLDLPAPRCGTRLFLVTAIALAALLTILAHGCHGPNEDHELFARDAREAVARAG